MALLRFCFRGVDVSGALQGIQCSTDKGSGIRPWTTLMANKHGELANLADSVSYSSKHSRALDHLDIH